MAELQEAEIRGRIKQARKQAGLSQVAMAELLAVIPRTVQNYENDHVPWTRIRDIADITGVSSRWLLHGDTEPPAEEQAQLDRIEQRLEELIELLTETDEEERVADALHRLRETVASPSRKAPVRSATRAAGERRKSA